jgi:murein DD-endopeptidase MepM/ murein hydrolase activator NlpD
MQRQLFRVSLLGLATISTTAAIVSGANAQTTAPEVLEGDGSSSRSASVTPEATSATSSRATSSKTTIETPIQSSINPASSLSSTPSSPRFSHTSSQKETLPKTAPARGASQGRSTAIGSHLSAQQEARADQKPTAAQGQSVQSLRQSNQVRSTPRQTLHETGSQPQQIMPPGIVPTLPHAEFEATTQQFPAAGILADGTQAELPAAPPELVHPVEPAWAIREAPELALGNAPSSQPENQDSQPESQLDNSVSQPLDNAQADNLLAEPDVAAVAAVEMPQPAQYQVQPGDTLNSIARRLGVPVQTLIVANHLDHPNQLRSGVTLNVSVAAPTGAVVDDGSSNTTDRLARLQQGATTSVDRIALMNRLRPTASQTNPEWQAPAVAENATAGEAVPEIAMEASAPEASVPEDGSLEDGAVAIAIPVIPTQTLPQLSEPQLIAPQATESQSPAPQAIAPQATEPAPVDSYAAELLTQVNVAQSRYAPLNVPSSPFIAADLPTMPITNVPSRSANSRYSSGQGTQATYPTTNYSATVAMRPSTVDPIVPELPGADRYLPEMSGEYNGYIWPTQGTFTSGYGPRWGRMHRGIDIAAPIGTPVVSAAPGVVEFAGWTDGGFGNLVDIRHPDGSMTRYAHNDRVLVRSGQYVAQGQLISEMGTTGRSTGPHLHFEIHRPDQGIVNPLTMLPQEVASIQF